MSLRSGGPGAQGASEVTHPQACHRCAYFEPPRNQRVRPARLCFCRSIFYTLTLSMITRADQFTFDTFDVMNVFAVRAFARLDFIWVMHADSSTYQNKNTRHRQQSAINHLETYAAGRK
jgi:hypothetical protein